uniref:Uncharacterized protein n=1 Tax=Romanomermis culicivorax TaxID=13658 RepID=A0A915IVE6_ROMCU
MTEKFGGCGEFNTSISTKKILELNKTTEKFGKKYPLSAKHIRLLDLKRADSVIFRIRRLDLNIRQKNRTIHENRYLRLFKSTNIKTNYKEFMRKFCD